MNNKPDEGGKLKGDISELGGKVRLSHTPVV